MPFNYLILKTVIILALTITLSSCGPIGGTTHKNPVDIWTKNNYLLYKDFSLTDSSPSLTSALPRAGCKKISEATSSKIDWYQVPKITTVIRAGDFVPMVMRIKQGRPYVLRIRNRDEKVRYFRALDFFRRNATISITVDGTVAKRTCVHSVHIPGRKSAEIQFVAIEDGHYEFEDNFSIVPMLMSAGPSGVIIIEERKDAILQEESN